jgi:hypothetical protein
MRADVVTLKRWPTITWIATSLGIPPFRTSGEIHVPLTTEHGRTDQHRTTSHTPNITTE